MVDVQTDSVTVTQSQPFHSPITSRERILLFGPEGCGKTTAYYEIAKRLRETRSKAKVLVCDFDWAADRMKVGYPGWEENMVIRTAEDYLDMIGILEGWVTKTKALGDEGRDYWLCPDGLGLAWASCKEHVIEKGYGREIADWMTDSLKSGKKDYGRTPDAQNFMWKRFIDVVIKFPGHVLGATHAKTLFMDGETKKPNDPNFNRYAAVGHVPDSQKTIGNLFHTVLFLNDLGTDPGKTCPWVFTTIKDRCRDRKTVEKMKCFPDSYLRAVGGWL